MRITVVDQGGSPVVGARLALVLPDLNHVPPEERARVEGVTNDEGQAHFVGTCVRGPIRGTIEAGSREPFEFVHGYLGNGRDRFQVELPAQGNDGA